jgi:hypothetical protein
VSDFEIEHGHDEYSAAELLEQAQDNAQALILATIAYLGEEGISPNDWAESVGASFARGWGAPRPWDAGEFLDAMLTNYRSLGAEVVSVDLGVDRAEATIADYPNPELATLFGVQPAQAGMFHRVAVGIARQRGLTWSYRLEGTATRLFVERART